MAVTKPSPDTAHPCPRCGETRFHVGYAVPVYALVEDGRVVRVVVADESIDPTPSDAESAGAVALTAPWPAWDVGW